MSDLNLPYEPVGPDPIEMGISGVLCGGVVYRVAVIDTEAGKMPAVVWDFYRADGERLSPIILVCTSEELLRLPAELRKAIRDVVRAAR